MVIVLKSHIFKRLNRTECSKYKVWTLTKETFPYAATFFVCWYLMVLLTFISVILVSRLCIYPLIPCKRYVRYCKLSEEWMEYLHAISEIGELEKFFCFICFSWFIRWIIFREASKHSLSFILSPFYRHRHPKMNRRFTKIPLGYMSEPS